MTNFWWFELLEYENLMLSSVNEEMNSVNWCLMAHRPPTFVFVYYSITKCLDR